MSAIPRPIGMLTPAATSHRVRPPVHQLAIAVALTSLAHAGPVTNWTERQGLAPVSNMNTASPTVGNGTAESADARSIYASMPPLSLANTGDKLTLSGSATLTGINTSGTHANQFRFGLFYESGTDTLGWLGYVGANGSSSSGANLQERNSPNTGWYFDSTGATTLVTAAAPGTLLTNATYNFMLSLERTSEGLRINSSIIRSDGQQFGLTSFLDPTPQTYHFNRVAFLMGGDMNADQVQFTNIDVTFVPATTPPSASIGARVIGIDFNRNDAPGAPSQSMFRVLGGSATQASNATTYGKTIGGTGVTVTQPDGVKFEFRGANSDSSRVIPGGDTSLSFLVADFIATRKGAIDLQITGLPAGTYFFRSHHLDTFTGSGLGFAQGTTTTTPNVIEAGIGGVVKAVIQPTALGANGLNTTFIADSQIPNLSFVFTHDGTSPIIIALRSTLSNGTDSFLMMNGFEIFQTSP